MLCMVLACYWIARVVATYAFRLAVGLTMAPKYLPRQADVWVTSSSVLDVAPR